jgi:allantoicase
MGDISEPPRYPSNGRFIAPVPAAQINRIFSRCTNVASAALHSTVLACSDDFFAAASNLLIPTAPIQRPGVFVSTGAWYDGWETRRHNPQPFDWVVIKLGVASAVIEGIEIDTTYFVGNYGEKAALQGTYAPSASGLSDEEIAHPQYDGWTTILPMQPCGPSQRCAWKLLDAVSPRPYTHVRLLMYPDGGFARLRLYGHVIPPPRPSSTIWDMTSTSINGEKGKEKEEEEEEEELSSALLGGLVLAASNQHFTPCSNLLLPGRGKDMGDGWETARSRTPGHVDWAIIRLGLAGSVHRVVVDTKDFRGNFPRAIRVHGLVASSEKKDDNNDDDGDDDNDNNDTGPDHPGWIELVKGDKLCQADTEHVYEGDDLALVAEEKDSTTIFTHVKLTLIPDGGVKRLRIFGRRQMTT